MIDLENKEERNKLIDDFFNKGLDCNIKEVYQAVVNTLADLEYENEEKTKEINKKEAMYDSLAVDYRLAQEEIERLKEKLKFEEATNKELLSTGAELEKKLYEEQDKNKKLKKELQEEKEEKEHYQAIVESWE